MAWDYRKASAANASRAANASSWKCLVCGRDNPKDSDFCDEIGCDGLSPYMEDRWDEQMSKDD